MLIQNLGEQTKSIMVVSAWANIFVNLYARLAWCVSFLLHRLHVDIYEAFSRQIFSVCTKLFFFKERASPGACFSKVPRTFRARKASRQTAICLF